MAWSLMWGGLAGNVPRVKAGAWLIYQDPAPLSGGAYVEVALWFGTPNTINYNGMSFNWQAWTDSGGQFASGSGSFNTSGSGVEKEVGRAKFNVPVTWRTPLDWHMKLSIPNPVGGGTATVQLDGWTPFARPAAPNPATATLLTGPERARLNWYGNQHVAARIQTITIDRYSGPPNGGAASWYRISTISNGDVTETYDTTLEKGYGYKYRVRAENGWPQQESGWIETGWIDTTPLDPSNVVAAKAANNIDVLVSWTNPPGWFTGRQSGKTEVWDVGSGTPILAATLDGGPSSWTHTSPSSSSPHRYNVRLKTYGTPTLRSSDQVLSNTVTLVSPPLAPTNVGPAVMDPLDGSPFTWTHNPVDTTAQSGFELQHRSQGSATWTTTGKVTSTVSAWTPPAGTYARGETVEVQVRTWGAHANPSPWSPTALIRMDGRPSATNQVPAAVSGAALAASHIYFDPEGTSQSAAVWRLLNAGGDVLETITIDGPATQAAFRTRLADGASYSADVQVRDGAGLWSNLASVTFTVTYLPPPDPVVDAAWDLPRAAAVLTVAYTAPDPATNVPADFLEVWRNDILIASIPAPLPGAPVTVVDPIPASTGETYTVVAWSTSPSSASVDITLDPDPAVSGAAWINAGPGWSYVAGIFHDLKVDVSSERSRDVQHFSGRAYPVEAIGEAIDESVKVSGRIPPGIDPVTFRRVQQAGTTVCLRWPAGRRFVSLGGIDTSASGAGTGHTVGFTGTVVDYTEG